MKNSTVRSFLAIGMMSGAVSLLAQVNGTAPNLAKFTSATSVGNSQIVDNGTSVTIATPSVIIGGASAVGGENFSVQKNWNGATFTRVYNNSYGPIMGTNSVSVNYCASAVSSGISMSAYGPFYNLNLNTMFEANSSVLNGSGSAMNIGTSGSSTPLTFWTSNVKRMTINNSGDVWINGGNQFTVKGGDMNHGLGYFDASTGFGGIPVDGPAVYGYSAGVLGTNQGGTKKAALKWDAYGQVTAFGTGLNTRVVLGSANGSSLGFGTSYMGLNAYRDESNLSWTRYSDGANNGGGVIFGAVDGSINFSPLPSTNGTANKTFADADVMANQVLRVRWNNALTATYKGQVIIGQKTQDPTQSSSHSTALLEVNGDVVVGSSSSANIFVTQTNWADFVFDSKYNLMSLADLEKYYKENHHLPNVPSTDDICRNGNNLGQTDAILLQKIEENTLYIVELKKQLEAQSKLIGEMAKRLAEKK